MDISPSAKFRMSSAPKCRVCGVAHWMSEPHVFKGAVPQPSELCLSASNTVVNTPAMVVNASPVVVNKTEPKKRTQDRHKDVEGRRLYHRENMRKRRGNA